MPQITGPLDQLYTSKLRTSFGWMRTVSDGNSLVRLDWNQTGWHELDRPDHVSRETKLQLQAFLDRRLKKFTLPLAPSGKNATGRHWLNIMEKIPYGTVISYAEFARFAGKPGAARAAGSSCANNPIPIIYPCHRVISTNGKLGNYGGGSHHNPMHLDNLKRKAKLIDLESC